MKFHMVRGLAALALLSFPLACLAAEDKNKDKNKPKSDPPGAPVQAILTAKKKTYKLDLGGKTAEEFKKIVKEAEGSNYPKAPEVELVLELKNTGDKDVEVWFKGDATKIMLDLKGKGAINTEIKGLAVTQEFRVAEAVKLAPGKTHKFEIKSLSYGFRGISNRSYWTQAGEYTLTATFHTATNPAVKGAKDAEGGFGFVTLTSAPLKIKVEDK
jgi:hypothetical protein